MAGRADILVRFGRRVRVLRKDQGYSQESFAYACELDRTYYSEREIVNPLTTATTQVPDGSSVDGSQ